MLESLPKKRNSASTSPVLVNTVLRILLQRTISAYPSSTTETPVKRMVVPNGMPATTVFLNCRMTGRRPFKSFKGMFTRASSKVFLPSSDNITRLILGWDRTCSRKEFSGVSLFKKDFGIRRTVLLPVGVQIGK